MSWQKVLTPAPPLEAEITEVSLTTSASTSQDTTAAACSAGNVVVITCDAAFKISFGELTGSTMTGKAVFPAGVYVFVLQPGRRFFKAKTVTGTGNMSWWLDKAS